MIAWLSTKIDARAAITLALISLVMAACGSDSGGADPTSSAAGRSTGGASAASGGRPNDASGGSPPGVAGAPGEGAATAGNNGTAGATGPSGTADLVAAFCSAASQCCADATPDCERYALHGLALAGVNDPSVKISQAVLTGCIAAYRSAAPDCARSKIREACRDLIVPTQNLGESCTTDQSCKADRGLAYCEGTDSSGTKLGACTLVTHLAKGQRCNTTYSTKFGLELAGFFTVPSSFFHGDPTACFESDGLVCAVRDGDGGTCQTPSSLGDSCASSSQCREAEACAMDLTCQTRTHEGQGCGVGCATDLTCTADVCRSQRIGSSTFDDESCNPLAPKIPIY